MDVDLNNVDQEVTKVTLTNDQLALLIQNAEVLENHNINIIPAGDGSDMQTIAAGPLDIDAEYLEDLNNSHEVVIVKQTEPES